MTYARENHNDRYPVDEAQFGRKLHNILPGVEGKRRRDNTSPSGRRQAYSFPTLDECRAAFERWIGHDDLDWGDDPPLGWDTSF